MNYQCGACGDNYQGTHECWLLQRLKEQEVLESPEQLEVLVIGELPQDLRIPERIRQVDISIL